MQKEKLQKVENASAKFVMNKYDTINDVLLLNWLLMEERIQINIAKLAFEILH